MNSDRTALDTHPQAPAESDPAWFVPGLLLNVCIRPGESSEALAGAGSCFGGCWGQLLVPIPGAVTCVSLALHGSGSWVPRGVLAAA